MPVPAHTVFILFVQVWITTLGLQQFDKDVITKGGLLCDQHMNAAGKVLSRQCPSLQGLQNTLLHDSFVPIMCDRKCKTQQKLLTVWCTH